ncbi:hypothetical protein BD779DRAFT_1556931 [Infundibulicybe gibba]|nr:hypothetical protein BD779DRAFT_1556931 [Infundibulicybe gibba]
MTHMKVVDANGESSMDEDQWEAASVFPVFPLSLRPLTRIKLTRYTSRSHSRNGNPAERGPGYVSSQATHSTTPLLGPQLPGCHIRICQLPFLLCASDPPGLYFRRIS